MDPHRLEPLMTDLNLSLASTPPGAEPTRVRTTSRARRRAHLAVLGAVALAASLTLAGSTAWSQSEPEPPIAPEPAPEPDPEPAPEPEPPAPPEVPEPVLEVPEPVLEVPEPVLEVPEPMLDLADPEPLDPEPLDPEPPGWLPSLRVERQDIDDRMYLLTDFGLGGMTLTGQFSEVFDAGGVGAVLRFGVGYGRFAMTGFFSVGTLESPVYTPLRLVAVGMEGRYYLPLGEGVDGLRLWALAGVGASWTTSCTEDESNCEPAGDPALSTYSGPMASLGAGVGWFFGEGVLGVFGDVRRARYWLDSYELARSIEGDVWVFTFGMVHELGVD